MAMSGHMSTIFVLKSCINRTAKPNNPPVSVQTVQIRFECQMWRIFLLTPYNHLSVLVFSWADVTVSPVDLHPLASVKFQQLLTKHLSGLNDWQEHVNCCTIIREYNRLPGGDWGPKFSPDQGSRHSWQSWWSKPLHRWSGQPVSPSWEWSYLQYHQLYQIDKKPNHKTNSYDQTVKCDLQKASIVQHLNNIIDDV